MRLERRGRVKPLQTSFNWQQEETDDCDKTVHHPETTGVRRLEGRQGQCGVCRRGQGDDRRLRSGLEEQSVSDLEPDVVGKLFPPPVKAVAIPKKNGGERILGVPTVADRVAQMVVKMTLEPAVEPIFLPDSYGYRPGKSALDAVAVTRTRCWKYDWVLEFDIKGCFDNID